MILANTRNKLYGANVEKYGKECITVIQLILTDDGLKN